MDLEERLIEFITSTFVNRCSVFYIQKELQRGLIPPVGADPGSPVFIPLVLEYLRFSTFSIQDSQFAPAAPYVRHGARMERESRRSAVSSSTKRSARASHVTLRPRRVEISARLHVVVA